MDWWKSPKSTTSTSSSIPSPGRSARRDIASLWTTDGKCESSHQKMQPCLTRQRKVRKNSSFFVPNLTEDFGGKNKSASADSIPMVRSSGKPDDVSKPGRSTSSPLLLLPHPLPLPEAPSRRFPPPSPRVRRGWGPSSARIGEDKSSEFMAALAEPVPERLPTTNDTNTVGRLHYTTLSKSPERFDVPAAVQKPGHRRAMLQCSNTIDDVFRLNIHIKSAPTSGICSPALSPRRPTSGDNFPSSHLTPQPPQNWSAPDFSDFTKGFHVHMPVEKFVVSPEFSPLHSPTAKSRSRSPSDPSSPLHQKIFPENSAASSFHGIINVHPLPLPPGAPGQSQPHFGQPSPTKGDVLPMGSQWKKGKLIGSGTFGSVYKATNRHTGALCAMKEVNIIPDDPKSIQCIKQLHQEIWFLSQLEDPNIVKYYGSEIIEDHFYIYLELVFPGSMNKYICDNGGHITESIVRNFTRHILMGLAYLHSKNAIHRDIKGANLLVDCKGIVKLADFGMAKHLPEVKCAYSMSGTPYWMAPEVLHASMNKEIGYNSAVDIWSLGCTIIEMYTGKHPWSNLSHAAAMFKILHNSPDIPETLSPEGKEFLQLCFRRNPAERPSASELLEHRFVTDLHDPNLHSSIQAFSEIKLSLTLEPVPSFSPPHMIQGMHLAHLIIFQMVRRLHSGIVESVTNPG